MFTDAADADYQALLGLVAGGKAYLERIKRFDMPDFKPRPEWVREMTRYGVLPSGSAGDPSFDVYAIEQRYWRSLWYQPPL